MLSYSQQQSWQKNPTHSLGIGQQQRMTYIVDFAQRLRETDSQRRNSMLFCRLENQPAGEEIQQHVARHLEGHAFRRAALQPTLHSLPNFQFAKHRLDFPAAMVQACLQNVARLVGGRHAHPILAGNDFGIEHVGDHGTGTKAGHVIADHPQRLRLRQLGYAFPLRTFSATFWAFSIPPADRPVRGFSTFSAIRRDAAGCRKIPVGVGFAKTARSSKSLGPSTAGFAAPGIRPAGPPRSARGTIRASVRNATAAGIAETPT